MFSINDLKEILLKCYSKDTCFPAVQDFWTSKRPTIGQCSVTSLIVRDYFGGDIYKTVRESHYYNVIDGKVVDLTASQFDYKVDYLTGIKKDPDLNKAQTYERYNVLKERVKKYIEKNNF